jgi:hypothetical protein
MVSSLSGNPEISLLSSGIISLTVLWILMNREALGFLASNHHDGYLYGIGLLALAFSMLVAGSYIEPRQIFYWSSLLIFVLSYVVMVYGKLVAKYMIPLIISISPLYALPSFTYVLGYAILSALLVRDFMRMGKPPCEHQYHSLSGSFCLRCGELSSKIGGLDRQSKAYVRSFVGVATIALLTLTYSNLSIATLASWTTDEPMITTYTTRGLLSEPIRDSGTTLAQASFRFSHGIHFSSEDNDKNAIRKRPLSDHSELLEFRTSSGIYEAYQLNGTRSEVLDLRIRVPYLDDGKLVQGIWRLHAASNSTILNSEGSTVKGELVKFGKEIDGRLALLGTTTVIVSSFSTIFDLSFPYILAMISSGLIIGSVTRIRQVDMNRDSTLERISALEGDVQLIALCCLSKPSIRRRALSGEEIHEEAKRLGFAGDLGDVAKGLKQLQDCRILTIRYVMDGKHIFQLWIAKGF